MIGKYINQSHEEYVIFQQSSINPLHYNQSSKFKMSKMLNLKQQKKYRNETMNVLSHLNSRTTVNKLDKSIKSFKTQKQQVQSSRVQNTSMFFKKDNKSIESQSRNGDKSYKSTKKNSLPKYTKSIEQSVQTRLKKIHGIFNDQPKQSYLTPSLEYLIREAGKQFKMFRVYIEERKQQMIFDDFDYLFNNIIKCFENKIATCFQISACEQMNKIEEFSILMEKTITEFQGQLKHEKQKFNQATNSFLEEIENLTVRSLYTTEKINYINYLGIFDFQKHCRQIDKEYQEDIEAYFGKSRSHQQIEEESILERPIQYTKSQGNNWCDSREELERVGKNIYELLKEPPYQYSDLNVYSIEEDTNHRFEEERDVGKNGRIRKQIPKYEMEQKTLSTDNYQRVNLRGGQFKIVLKDKQ